MAGADAGYASYAGPQEEGLRIGHININSLLKKLDVVKDVISYYDFDILAISETHLDRATQDYHIELPGYKTRGFREDRAKKSGGLLVYVRDSYTVRWKQEVDEVTVYQDFKDSDFQYIQIEITHPIALRLVAIYRHKDFSKPDFCEKITGFIENSKTKIILLGDFNINYLNKVASEELRLIESNHGLTQLVKHNTYHKMESATLLDHIYTNFPEGTILESGIIRLAISDHDLVYCTLTVDEPLQRRTQDLPAGKNVKLKSVMPECLQKLGKAKCNFLQSQPGPCTTCTKKCSLCQSPTKRCSCTRASCNGCSCLCRCEHCQCKCTVCAECTWRTCRKVREVETRQGDIVARTPQRLPISSEAVKSAIAKIEHPLSLNGDEEAKSKIEEHLCDMFNALLSRSEETDVEEFVYDTFESTLMQTQEQAVIKALQGKVQEYSVTNRFYLYACLYKFTGSSLDEDSIADLNLSDLQRKRLKTYVAQREVNNAKPANMQNSKLRRLSQKINDEAAAESGVCSFHCGKEILIFQREEKNVAPQELHGILEANKGVLQDAKDKEFIIFGKIGVDCEQFDFASFGLTEPLRSIRFLGTQMDNRVFDLSDFDSLSLDSPPVHEKA